MNPSTGINEGTTVLADIDIEKNGNPDSTETQIDASALECDSIVHATEKETIAKYQKPTQKQKESLHEKEEYIAIATHSKKSKGPSKCYILCAFVVVAVASGVAGAMIARRQSPSTIAVPGAPQTKNRPTSMRPATTAPTQTSPSEQPTPRPSSAPTTASPTDPASNATPRQSNIFDAFSDFGPVHEGAFEWLLNTDEWIPPTMTSDTKQLWYERYAVATFLFSTNVAYLADSAFRTVHSVCDWAGVECSDGLKVDTLDFSHSLLGGRLPTEIGILTGLSYFDIANNNVGGSLPSEIGLLSNLGDIILSQNEMTGTLPTELGMMARPWFLYGDNNMFSGKLPPQLGRFLGVDLSFNELSENLPGELFTEKLSMLILNDNDISGSLPEEVGSASQLTTLWLWNNALSGSIPPLNEILSSCKLQNNGLSDTTNGDGVCIL